MPISNVRATHNSDYSGTSISSLTSGSFTPTYGNHLCVVVHFNSGGVTSVTDTGGHTWVKDGAAGVGSFEVWYVTRALTSASVTVTVTFSTSAPYRHFVVFEHIGAGGLGGSAYAAVASGTTISGTPTVAGSGNQVCVAGAVLGGAIALGFSFTPTTFTVGHGGSATFGYRIATSNVFDGTVPVVATHADSSLVKRLGAAVFTEAAVYRVNAVNSNNYVGSTSLTQASPAIATYAGNHLTVLVRNAGAGVASVADSAGNTFVKAGDNGANLQVWYAENTAAHATNVVTVTFSVAANYRDLTVIQYAGLATSGSLAAFAGNSVAAGTLTVACTPSVSVTTAPQVCVVAADVNASGAPTLTPSGFDSLYNNTSTRFFWRYDAARVFDGSQAITATFGSTSAGKGIVAAVFIPAAAAAAAAADATLIWPPF